ncbi:MAG: 4-hydroxy-3-methylbut-2-enyl diphosphate reductase [Thermoanaerobacteraceae bacterium]|nr:4-hydroxy-3-methylbut-2-enyl diphosphate reductase [Thermoanaerobacteraceae bacterium]
MKVIVANHAGFCFGVKRAVEKAYEQLNKKDNIKTYTLGELIHNPHVVNDLYEKGIKSIEDINSINENSRIIIRTHGISEDLYSKLKEKNLEIEDMTCPFVKKVQNIVKKYYNNGYNIIIVGDEKHPEVRGVNGWCNNTAYIINSNDNMDIMPKFNKACVVAQTTITQEQWEKVLKILKNKVKELISFNTICDATNKRQKAAEELSHIVDIMIVIGGKKSSNTQKLKKICEKNCKKTYQIESKEELNLILFKKDYTIGITAGASTPGYIINDVVNELMYKKGE